MPETEIIKFYSAIKKSTMVIPKMCKEQKIKPHEMRCCIHCGIANIYRLEEAGLHGFVRLQLTSPGWNICAAQY